MAARLNAWSESRKGRRKGRQMGFPRFRKKGRGREPVGLTTAIRVDDKSHVVLPRIGRVRTHEPTTARLERIEAGNARILLATVSRKGGRWFVSLTGDVAREPKTSRCSDAVVGGHRASPPGRPLGRGAGAEPAAAQEGAPNARPPPPGHPAKRTTRLARTYGTVVVERLHVAGMLRNRRLARSVAGASLAGIQRQLRYEAVSCGSQLVEAERFYPSSRTCS